MHFLNPTPEQAAQLAARLQVVDLDGELCIVNVDSVVAIRLNEAGRLVMTYGMIMSEGHKIYYQSEQVSATLETTDGFLLDTAANRALLQGQINPAVNG